ncbi:MAG: hypothetical protein WBB60_08000, partial [Nitrospira sp.]
MSMTQKRTGKRAASKKTPATPQADGFGAEGVMADLSRIMREQAFESLDDATRFMQRLMAKEGGTIPRPRTQEPAE